MRQDFTAAFKREVCCIVEENSELSQAQLLELIEQRTTAIILQSNLSRIVAGKDRWLTCSLQHRRRLRFAQHDQIEQALVAWAHD